VVVTEVVTDPVVVLKAVEVVHHMITAADLTQEVVHLLHSEKEVPTDVNLTILLPVIETLSLVGHPHVVVTTPQEIAPLLNIATVSQDLPQAVIINEVATTE